MNNVSQKTAPGRTHLERRREAERRILSAALEIVAERGLDGLTLQEAGEAAGFSRALPAHYFGTREVMLAAVVEQAVSGYRERLAASGHGRLTGIEALFDSLAFLASEARRAPQGLKAFYEVIDSAPRRPALAPTAARVQAENLERAIAQLQAAIAAGEIRADLDPQIEAVLFVASVRGLIGYWLASPAEFDLESARDALIARLRRAWAPD